MHDDPSAHAEDLEEPPKISEDIAAYYEKGNEEGRLNATPEGRLEFIRTKELLKRFLPKPPAVIADVGGGPGAYACWLASQGHEVHLVDPVPLHIQQARTASAKQSAFPIASCTLGDAREMMQFQDGSMDMVLLLGPLTRRAR